MAEFIVETRYLSRRIIRQTDNLSKYKSEDEFWRIICLDIYLFIPGNIEKTSPSHVETSSKNRLSLLDINLETDNPSNVTKTNTASVRITLLN